MTLGTDLDDGAWHALAVSLDNESLLTITLDGTTLGTGPDVAIDFDTFSLFDIGHEWDPGPAPSDFFAGEVDDVQIWNAALDLETINFLQCTHHWGLNQISWPTGPMDTMVGDVVPDASDNAHDGTLFGVSGLADPAPDSCDGVDIQPGCTDPTCLQL